MLIIINAVVKSCTESKTFWMYLLREHPPLAGSKSYFFLLHIKIAREKATQI